MEQQSGAQDPAPSPVPRGFLIIAAASGLVAVAFAALTGHSGNSLVAPGAETIVSNAILFQLTHAICLLLLTMFAPAAPKSVHKALSLSAYGFALGLILFCLPLYWLGMKGPGSLGPLSFLTPIGGGGFLLGWAGLSWAGMLYALKKP